MKRHKYIFLLAGGLKKGEDGRWHTILGKSEGDKFGFSDDRLRVAAAAALWEKDNNLTIISSGGRGQLDDVLPVGLTISNVIKNELRELGVSSDKIKEENKSGTTYQQLTILSKMIKSGEISGDISIISNEWHLPRIKAIIDYTDLKNVIGARRIKLIAAEGVLLRLKSAEWREFIEEAKESEALKKRLQEEARGVEQIKNGTYNFK